MDTDTDRLTGRRNPIFCAMLYAIAMEQIIIATMYRYVKDRA